MGTEEEIKVSRFWASMYSLKPRKRIEARSMLYPAVRDCDPAKIVQFAEFVGAIRELAPCGGLHTGTLILTGLPHSVEQLSVSWRRAARNGFYPRNSYSAVQQGGARQKSTNLP
jgi:hypothetical protein